MCCSQLCSHCGWLLLKCSAIGIGFNGAETNCRIAHILGILLMNSCNTDRFLATTVVYGLSTLKYKVWASVYCTKQKLGNDRNVETKEKSHCKKYYTFPVLIHVIF